MKKDVYDAIHDALKEGARQKKACEIVGITPRTFQNWIKRGFEDKRKGSCKRVLRKLDIEEREEILEVCNSERFRDMNPHQIVPILAQEGKYLASESTIYRVLREADMIHHRDNTKPARNVSKPPQVVATGPGQVFTWDITWLHSKVRGLFFYAYVLQDIYDRSIVSWEIHDRESDEISQEMFRRLSQEKNLKGAHLHSDNGHPMKGVNLLGLLLKLGVSTSFSRPRVSDDNPFIESFFKTLKYSTKYPGRFEDLSAAREWFASFIHWYNNYHLHSALGYVTPLQRRRCEDVPLFHIRNRTMEQARSRNPERWGSRPARQWISEDSVVLNPDKHRDSSKVQAERKSA
jgi:transposase InsO family protein